MLQSSLWYILCESAILVCLSVDVGNNLIDVPVYGCILSDFACEMLRSEDFEATANKIQEKVFLNCMEYHVLHGMS